MFDRKIGDTSNSWINSQFEYSVMSESCSTSTTDDLISMGTVLHSHTRQDTLIVRCRNVNPLAHNNWESNCEILIACHIRCGLFRLTANRLECLRSDSLMQSFWSGHVYASSSAHALWLDAHIRCGVPKYIFSGKTKRAREICIHITNANDKIECRKNAKHFLAVSVSCQSDPCKRPVMNHNSEARATYFIRILNRCDLQFRYKSGKESAVLISDNGY